MKDPARPHIPRGPRQLEIDLVTQLIFYSTAGLVYVAQRGDRERVTVKGEGEG